LTAQVVPASPILQSTIAAIDGDGLPKLKTDLDEQCLAAISGPRISDPRQILSLSACREFARYFGAIEELTSAQKETLKWLAAQPHLMPTLMSAVYRRDSPEQVIEILDLLRKQQPERLDEYPDLATAMVVVWDKPLAPDANGRTVTYDDDRPAVLFNYFTNPRNQMRFDLKSMPWQLDTHIVDMRISEDEIPWAAERYRNNYSIADLYFEVNYDDRNFYNGDEKKIAAHAYTLQNILQYGGVCVEQAYFAEQIAKTLGIPSCTCTSRGGGAGQAAHAWLGLLTQQNGKAAWNFDEGRYKEDLFWSANIVDPQTHGTLTDADVGLLAELQNVSPATRQVSALELKLADLLPAPRRVDLYLREIEICPGNRSAWVALDNLGAKLQLTPAQTDTFGRDVDRFLTQSYPDFACQMLVHLVSGEPAPDQVNSLDVIAQKFPQRPDLKARVRLIQADLLLSRHQDEIAMRALTDVLTNDLNAGPIIQSALQRVDKLMRQYNNLPGLANIYSNVWGKLPLPDRSAYVYWTPYYLIGKTYMALLESMGRPADADVVRQKLIGVIPAGAELR
jgi:hypothetical protein